MLECMEGLLSKRALVTAIRGGSACASCALPAATSAGLEDRQNLGRHEFGRAAPRPRRPRPSGRPRSRASAWTWRAWAGARRGARRCCRRAASWQTRPLTTWPLGRSSG